MPQVERDFPIGHPAAIDTIIGSPDHLAWVEQHKFEENLRDFPPGHPKAIDTPGNLNHLPAVAGVDPHNTQLEPFTGRTPQAAAAIRKWNEEEGRGAHESPVLPIVDASIAEAALAAKRAELKVDALTMEQHMEVLADLQRQGKTRPPDPPAPTTSGAQFKRMTQDEAQAALNGAPMPESWFPTTGKPWWGPSQ